MNFAVKFENVYKEYPLYQHITAGFKSFLFNLPRNIASLKRNRFIALKDVSFEVKKGEALGIIGRNGSGKSTILGLIAGVLKSDRGRIIINGKVSSLLELGAGFHPELSGIENIILNGILMGNTKKDMIEKLNKIVEFAELGDFIYQPLRTFSSGMYMRLGFSVAIHIEPEILLIDEVLAVGDLNFQEKCMKKLIEFKESGVTIILVSHDMASIVKLCDRVIWIDNGSIMTEGNPKSVVKEYLNYINKPINFPEEPEQVFTETEESEDSIPQTHSYSSWWEFPTIVEQCETLITGSPDLTLYEFLKKHYFSKSFKKGLSICNRLKGIETEFIIAKICKSFDIIDEKEELSRIIEGQWNLKKNHYDFFLCIDILHKVKRLDLFLKDINSSLKEGAGVIAIEYIGPLNPYYSTREIEIAESIYNAISNTNSIKTTSPYISSDTPHTSNTLNQNTILTDFKKFFDILEIKYFGGPFYDLVLNKLINILDPNNEKDTTLIRTIVQLEQILIKEGILKNRYALIIARKKKGNV